MAKKFKLKANVYFHEVKAVNNYYGVFAHVPVIVKDKEDIKHFEDSSLFEEVKESEGVKKPAKKKVSKKKKE